MTKTTTTRLAATLTTAVLLAPGNGHARSIRGAIGPAPLTPILARAAEPLPGSTPDAELPVTGRGDADTDGTPTGRAPVKAVTGGDDIDYRLPGETPTRLEAASPAPAAELGAADSIRWRRNGAIVGVVASGAVAVAGNTLMLIGLFSGLGHFDLGFGTSRGGDVDEGFVIAGSISLGVGLAGLAITVPWLVGRRKALSSVEETLGEPVREARQARPLQLIGVTIAAGADCTGAAATFAF